MFCNKFSDLNFGNLWNAPKNPYVYTCSDFYVVSVNDALDFSAEFSSYEFPILKPFPMGYCLSDSNTFPLFIVLGVGKSINVATTVCL